MPVTRCIIAKNGQNATDTYMLCVTLCNVLSEIVKRSRVDLFSNAIFVAQPDISTPVWVKLHWLSVFTGEIGVMETIFPHCQQSFQHKCSAINEVMLTNRRFLACIPPLMRQFSAQTHASAAAAHFLPGGRRLRAQKTPGAHGSRGGW